MSMITDSIFSGIARFLARRHRLVEAITSRAMQSPYFHLHNPDRSLYMERYWVIGPKSLLRFIMPQMRLHIIHTPDNDRHPHDHPWAFRSLILAGGYREVRWKGPDAGFWFKHIRERKAGESYAMRLGQYHRITVVDGPVTTLCILGRRQKVWGFLVDGQKVPWRRYFNLPADAPEGSQP